MSVPKGYLPGPLRNLTLAMLAAQFQFYEHTKTMCRLPGSKNNNFTHLTNCVLRLKIGGATQSNVDELLAGWSSRVLSSHIQNNSHFFDVGDSPDKHLERAYQTTIALATRVQELESVVGTMRKSADNLLDVVKSSLGTIRTDIDTLSRSILPAGSTLVRPRKLGPTEGGVTATITTTSSSPLGSAAREKEGGGGGNGHEE